tara:strand:+ start:66723 stop:67190 length:468 start_codon:yes stop_codon:yes gene_type:complete
MNKFLGILFFYVLAFIDERAIETPYDTRGKYLREKSRRFLGLNISESQWKLLKIYLTDLPRPRKDNPLSSEDIYVLIKSFDEVFNLENLDYELRMYGIPYEEEMKTIDECFDRLSEIIEILGSSNGVSVTIGHWLQRTEFDRKLITREMNLIEFL